MSSAPSKGRGKAYDNSGALQTRVGWVPVIRLDNLSLGVGHRGGCHFRPLDSKNQRTLSNWTFVGWSALTIRGGSGVVPWWWWKWYTRGVRTLMTHVVCTEALHTRVR